MRYDVTLLTEPRYENPVNPDWYDLQILKEDGFVRAALEAKGLVVNRISWDTPDFDWSATRLAVFRTTWDYFNRIEEFLPWLEETSLKTRFLNPYQLVKWNINKRYLLDLATKGIRIPDTILVEKGEKFDLNIAFEKWSCQEIIIKPCVGGTARHTHRIHQSKVLEYQLIMNELLGREQMLVQPFLTNVLESGEVSALVFGGRVSHAVKKMAKAGDFRVQDDFGGTVQAHVILSAEQELAEKAILACPLKPAYARVDMIYNADGLPVISELEMVEPELFFRFNPGAAQLLADEIRQALNEG